MPQISDRRFQIDNILNHACIGPEHIKKIATIRVNAHAESMLFLIRYPSGEDRVVSTRQRDCGDVRANLSMVQRAYCRVTGMTRKTMEKAVAEWREEQRQELSELHQQKIQELADEYGFTVTLTKKES